MVLNSESKLQALVTELRKMRDEDGSNKALIFSQFNSTLSWLQERLPEEGFGFRTISGKHAGSSSATKRSRRSRRTHRPPCFCSPCARVPLELI